MLPPCLPSAVGKSDGKVFRYKRGYYYSCRADEFRLECRSALQLLTACMLACLTFSLGSVQGAPRTSYESEEDARAAAGSTINAQQSPGKPLASIIEAPASTRKASTTQPNHNACLECSRDTSFRQIGCQYLRHQVDIAELSWPTPQPV